MFKARESAMETYSGGSKSNRSLTSEAPDRGESSHSQVESHSGGLAVFDKAGFMSRLDGDEDLAREVVGIFLAQSSTLMTNLRRAADQRDAYLLERAAHALKSTFGDLSATEALEVSRLLEESAREGHLDDANAMLPTLDSAINRLTCELRNPANGVLPQAKK